MQINYNKHIVKDPVIEIRTMQHYFFIKEHFCDSYIHLDDFLKRIIWLGKNSDHQGAVFF